MKPFVRVDGLQKQYNPPDGVFAVGKNGGIDFEIHEGEIFSLLGPNGAGKTTTISMMSTLLSPTHGDITIGEYSVIKNPIQAKQQIGVVPQELALYPSLNARQNLEFFGRMYGLHGKQLRSRAEEVLGLIDLTDRAEDKIQTYSGGMKRRVNIGVGLMHRPRLVFLDEPTVGIDPQSRRRILDTVKQLNREGMAVLYTTHYMEEAQELSDRIGIIDNGQIIAMGTLGELVQSVGEKDNLIFKVTDVPQETLDKISALELVDHVTPKIDEGELHVLSPRGRKILPEVIHVLTEYGLGLQSVEVKEPNLEAVFLSLTGRALRE